jgi:hypothetical protein
MELQIDHVTVAGRNLDRLVDAFDAAGFDVAYGGRHSNGVTHMGIVGFRDGTYLELISTLDPDTTSPWWNDPIHHDGGPCAWAIDVDDIETATDTLADRGITVDGPTAYRRTREDDALVEWDLTALGSGDPGSLLPFLISDRTPRSRRVTPTEATPSTPIRGVDTVVLGVRDVEDAIDRVGTAVDVGTPRWGESAVLGARIASPPDRPVAFAEPQGDGWLAERLETFGPRPVGYLLGHDGGDRSRFGARSTETLCGRSVEWLSVTAPTDHRYLGLVADR